MLRLVQTRLYRAELMTRMPFRFGIANMTAVPHVFVDVQVEFADGVRRGVAADHLPPKWFTKNPSRSVTEEISEMELVISHAQGQALEIGEAASPFAFWQELWKRSESWVRSSGLPPLLVHFGTSLVERAVIDAFCRARGQSFAAALRENTLGIDLGAIHPSLAGSQPRSWLRPPPQRLFARHTVGLSDPLTEAEMASEDRLDDGLPQSLEACIGRYGLHHFKIKIGKPDDLPRLRAIAAVLDRFAPADYACTLDGNENFPDLAGFKDFWSQFSADPSLAEMRSRLLFVEQPFHRAVALTPEIGAMAERWPSRPPIVIDESDAELCSLPQALALGYSGTTHKNCKGVMKGIANACLLAQRRRERPGVRWSFSGEDLSNIGPVALLQDLAAQAALGVESVERNGHHYFAGLSMWPKSVQTQVLRHHPDLYRETERGWPAVRIEDGTISVASVAAAPFGVGFEVDPAVIVGGQASA
jgi:hypothetical protein